MPQKKLELTWFNKNKVLIPAESGKYGYIWVDPRDPRYCETHTLTFLDKVTGTQTEKQDGTQYSERADLEPQDDNLLILGESGDVLETLTRVPELRDKYVGQVKCIYIDPPFNTAQTFANYEDNLEHSVWLTMMRDRLIHLRNLLSNDGSIWVHLDDVENHRMRLLLDEVFGCHNFVTEVLWRKRNSSANDSNSFTSQHDILYVYAKDRENYTLNKIERPLTVDDLRFKSIDGDPMIWGAFGGVSAPKSVGAKGVQVRSVYGIEHPFTRKILYPPKGRQWAFRPERIREALAEYGTWVAVDPDLDYRAQQTGLDRTQLRADIPDLVIGTEDTPHKARERFDQGIWPEFYISENMFARKIYQSDDRLIAPNTWWTDDQVGHNREAKSELKELFPEKTPFSTPKPERLLERIIHVSTQPGDIILDIFGGSGTTAAVAQKMGRRWVLVELLPETFAKYTLPRLEKVVLGIDVGGVSTDRSLQAHPDVKVPVGYSPNDLKNANELLNAIKSDDGISEEYNTAINSVKKLLRTIDPKSKSHRNKAPVNWRGGGSFTVAKLAPSCYDYSSDTGYTYLTPEATGDILVRSIAANVGFYLTENDMYFDGRRNNEHLAVIEGVLTEDKVGDLMAHLPEGHSILFAATILDDGIREIIRSYKNGSRALHIPLDLFPYSEEEES